MSDNTSNITPHGSVPPVDSPDQPMPLVPAPTTPVTQGDLANAGSNYEIVRGSAAAVVAPTTAVATRAKKRDQSVLDRGKRGVSSPPSAKIRSSVEDSPSPRRGDGTPGQIMQLQNQVRALHERLTTLEAAHREGNNAIGSFADRLVGENARLDQRLTDV